MSQVNVLTYQVTLTPENASKIDQINRILLGEGYTTSSPDKAANTKKTTTSTTKQTAVKDEVVEETTETGPSMDDLKSAAKKAKAAHGEDFVKQVVEDNGVKPLASLGRTMGKIPPESYEAVIAAWNAGPVEDASDDLDDDDLGDDLDDDLGEEAPTPEAVKLALKAMSQGGDRDGAKAIMQENGAKKLSDVDNCTPAQLTAMFAKLT